MTAQLALDLRDHGQQQVTEASDEIARNAVDQAIRVTAARGVPFTCNDLRALLPDVRPALVGARFTAAHKAGVIRPTGHYVRSTLPSTRGHVLTEWVRA